MGKPTIADFRKLKEAGKKFSMVTAYDYGIMSQVDNTDIGMVLVGDSSGMVMMGHDSTLPVTLEQIIMMSQWVSRAAANTFVVSDMPYMSYEVSIEKAVENAGRIMKEGAVDAVKLEGGTRMARTIRALVDAGVPVMAHIGLTPQSASQIGGFKVQGKDFAVARELIDDALAVEEAGAFSVVIEAVPAPLAKMITERLAIPTIGIGAGVDCDAQVLVIHDLLGLFHRFTPKFVKKYASIGQDIQKALHAFHEEVQKEVFPGPEHSFNLDADIERQLAAYLESR